MNQYLSYNGELLKDDKPLLRADNRGLRYGDGLFETIRFYKGQICLQDYHFERLFKGLELLQFELPSYFGASHLATQILHLCQKNNHPNARVRLMVFRGNGGLFDPENHLPNCIIQSMPLTTGAFSLNESGLMTGVYPGVHKSMDTFANLKSNNYLPYIMAALYARQQQWNEALLQNSAGRICDATIANLFIVKRNKLYTPALSEGCVAGVMRRWIIEKLQLSGYDIEESTITIDDLTEADEMFFTNSIQGIRWVQQCDKTTYTNQIVNIIYDELLKNPL
jgi:branched-chain amino acid aminotransferase